ncbi:MAG: dUTP diphosphatase [Actinobacteria bacterium]|nr:dUTP diphosphatase [Actinomycetota bacterium]
MHSLEVRVKRTDPSLPLPEYAHDGDAGLDLYAAENASLRPFERSLIATGIAVAIPEGYAGFVQPRSGLALRNGLTFVNTPGLIDSHYRGEIKLVAVNLDPQETLVINKGQKIAQLVIQSVGRASLVEVDDLGPTVRGTNGFGSTGI